MKVRRWAAVFMARNREFLRDRTTLTWNLLFPLMLVLAFAFAFSGEQRPLYKVGLYGEPDATLDTFLETRYTQFLPVASLDEAIAQVDRHQLDMLLDAGDRRYWINSTSPRGYILERVLAGSGAGGLARETLSGREVRYVDWLMPGVLGMNVMFSCLFGVGYVIVRYRKNGVLRRLKATPLRAHEFLLAQIMSRLLLVVTVTVLLYFGTDLLVDFRMLGSYLNLLLVLLAGSVSLVSLGLVVASRLHSDELAGGILNLLSWPMMFLSGVWFSLEGMHPLLQRLALCLPLTHLIAGARAVMIDGAGLLEMGHHVLILMAMALFFLGIGAWIFRWE